MTAIKNTLGLNKKNILKQIVNSEHTDEALVNKLNKIATDGGYVLLAVLRDVLIKVVYEKTKNKPSGRELIQDESETINIIRQYATLNRDRPA